MMHLAHPYFLFLLLLLIPYIVWYVLRHRQIDSSIQVSSTLSLRYAPRSWKEFLVHFPFLLRIVAFAMIVVILSRPQRTDEWENHNIEGIDIMLCMDVSTSMLAEDLKPNRLEAAKKVAADFIEGRPSDNIGLTLFAAESFTQCPMTTDHSVLLSMLLQLSCDNILEDGTAIGMGLSNSINHLKDSKAKSKVIILLTDGSNNVGEITPLMAAEIAKQFGIRIYTIGVGTNGTAPYPVVVAGRTQYLNIPVEIDTKTLASIAATTGGEFYRATSTSKLSEVYHEIDKMEKTKMEVRQFVKYKDSYLLFALIACCCLLLELLLRETILKKLP